jgi:hypothetical protein
VNVNCPVIDQVGETAVKTQWPTSQIIEKIKVNQDTRAIAAKNLERSAATSRPYPSEV